MPRNDRVEGEIIPTRITNMQSIVEIDPCFFFSFFLFLKASGQTEKHAILSPLFLLVFWKKPAVGLCCMGSFQPFRYVALSSCESAGGMD